MKFCCQFVSLTLFSALLLGQGRVSLVNEDTLFGGLAGLGVGSAGEVGGHSQAATTVVVVVVVPRSLLRTVSIKIAVSVDVQYRCPPSGGPVKILEFHIKGNGSILNHTTTKQQCTNYLGKILLTKGHPAFKVPSEISIHSSNTTALMTNSNNLSYMSTSISSNFAVNGATLSLSLTLLLSLNS